VEFWQTGGLGLAGRFVLKNSLRAEHAKPRGRDFLSPLNDYHDIQVTANPFGKQPTARRTLPAARWIFEAAVC